MRWQRMIFVGVFFELGLFLTVGLQMGGCSSSRKKPPRDGQADSDANTSQDANTTLDGGGDGGGDDGDAATVSDGATQADSSVNPGDPLQDRLTTSDITVPEGVMSGYSNWRIWGRGSLNVAPVFTVPLANCETLVGYTTSGGGITPRVARISAQDTLVETHTLTAGLECRGLAAEPDGHFAALLWDDGADAIFVTRYDPSGNELWTEELVNSDNKPDDFGIGDSRMDFGGNQYGAYYHVHSDSGHEGDTLKWVTTDGTESTGWGWGCSHSMSVLLRYNPQASRFMPACVTDCFPGTPGDFSTTSRGGIYLNHNSGPVIEMCAGCNGSVAGELGSGALSPSGWKIVFNAHQADLVLGQSSYDSSVMNQDIGFSSIDSNYSHTGVVWLTSTELIDEADSTIARWTPVEEESEQYVVGWAEPGSPYVYKLGRVDPTGSFLEGPIDISSLAGWGRRDDPMRRHEHGDVVWAWFDSSGSTTMHFARLFSGRTPSCASF